jgi:2-oxo-hept-3-ene-1,7-dioate hydratase
MLGRPVADAGAAGSRGWALDRAYDEQAMTIASLAQQWSVAPAGFKISITNEADQLLVGASEPTYGRFLSPQVLGDGAQIDLASSNEPLLEPELVMRVVERVDPSMGAVELAARVEIAAGLEIPMSRLGRWWPDGQLPRLTLGDLVADNSAAGVLVHGGQWWHLTAPQVRSIEVVVEGPGTTVAGAATRVLGDPLRALAWIVAALAGRGESLDIGSVVSTGTFTPPVRIVRGCYAARFTLVGSVGVEIV